MASTGGQQATGGSSAPAQTQAAQTEVSLLGTLGLPGVAALLHHVTGRAGVGLPVAVMPGTTLCERETVLQRVDDDTSSIRETGDNAWASVVKARRGVRLHVVESLDPDRVVCKLLLPLPALPERQYPRATVRPTHTVQMLSRDVQPNFASAQHTPLSTTPLLPFNPDECLETDPANGWKSFVSAIGWSPPSSGSQPPRFVRYGLSFALNHVFSRNAPGTTNPLAPTQSTRFTLNVYRIFVPPPADNPDGPWTPIDPLGATVVVHLTATIGGQLDQAHFNPYSAASAPSTTGAQAGGLDPASTVENAIELAEAIARSLRGFVDLRRLNTD